MTNLPVTGSFSITAVYGQSGSYWKNGHKGIDFVSANKNIYSTCDGTVRVVAYDEGGWGNYVSVGDSEGRRHIFCHLSSVRVKVGDTVTRTSVLGIMGDTGNVTGVHLHYQINDKNNLPVDPSGYLGIPNKKGNYNSEDFTVMNFKDQNEISEWALASVKKVSDLGIMVGDANGNFRPKDNITRQEIAVVIAKLLDKE
ncbi:MAG: peptidoglycan DD-metalloendopeptidase family protein [Clostridia bacterium]|nr:peptidoglycan DD-metalloendopeptidase family protein [Clostridia bacterium]